MVRSKKIKIQKRVDLDSLLSQGKEMEKKIIEVNSTEVKSIVSKSTNKQSKTFTCLKELQEVDTSNFVNTFENLRAYSELRNKLKYISEIFGLSLTELLNKIIILWLSKNENDILNIIKEHNKKFFK